MEDEINKAIRLLRQNGYFVKKIPAKLDKFLRSAAIQAMANVWTVTVLHV